MDAILQSLKYLYHIHPGHIFVAMKKNGSIKQKIYEIRRSKGISQEKVATAIGIALNNYRKLERGKTVLINEKLWDIAAALNVSVKELVLEEDPHTRSSLADLERAEYLKRIHSLEEEIDTLKQCINILNEKNESYVKHRGSAYP